jgi:hypothetical protein
MGSIVPGFEGLSGPAEAMFNQLVYDAKILRSLEGRDPSTLPFVEVWVNQQIEPEAEIPSMIMPEDAKKPTVIDFVGSLVIDFEDKEITAENNGGSLSPEEYILALYMHNKALPKAIIDEVAKHISETGLHDEFAHAEFLNALDGGANG